MIFLGGKKSEAFHFQRCYPGKSILTRADRKPAACNVKNREEPRARIVHHCVWHSTCYNARHIVSRNNPAYTAGYTRMLLSPRHFYPRFNARLPWVTFTESA